MIALAAHYTLFQRTQNYYAADAVEIFSSF
jgi:hypothetical protein